MENERTKSAKRSAAATIRARLSEDVKNMARNLEAQRRKKQREKWKRRGGIESATASARKKLQQQF